MRVRFLEPAMEELMEGSVFYEKQSEGLGLEFLTAILSETDELMYTAGIHPIRFGEYHMLLVKQFPFAIYYTVEGNVIVVHAVSDCRRDPAWIKKRLS